jgi:hypothetical protein
MKLLFRLLGLLIIFVFLVTSCNENDKTEPNNAIVIQHSGCNEFNKTINQNHIQYDESCITYNYDIATEILYLRHSNAGFNCDPGDITTEIELEGNTITISEFESSSFADCLCLYDLDMEISSISPQQYQIIFVEPFILGQEELNFSIDLSETTVGKVCASREKYPWH